LSKPICQPPGIGRCGPIQPHLSDLHRCHAELDQIAAGRIQCREVHENEVVPILLVPTDALVVIDQVPAAVEDEPVPIDLDWTRMMGRVAVDDVHAAVDQPVCKPDVLARYGVSPIAAPMDRGNGDVLAPLDCLDALLDGRGNLRLFENRQAGDFQPLPGPASFEGLTTVTIGDAGDDGMLDLLTLDARGSIRRASLEADQWVQEELVTWSDRSTNAAAGTDRLFLADLDNNGQAEVIFTTWTQKSSSQTGKLYILSSQGAILQAVSLPAAVGGGWNGGLPAPTLANLDSDADLEIVINTSASGLIAYDLPGTANARILWGTGRGSFLRSGSILTGSLAASTWSVTPPTPQSGDLLHFTITLRSAHPDLFSASATETIPPGLSFAGNLSASSGTVSQAGGTVSWKGFVSSSSPVTIRFDALSTNPDPSPQVISYPALFEDGFGNQFTRQITVILNGTSIFLPVVAR